MSSLVLIDNFDSFTYNIVQAFRDLKMNVRVIRNHAMSAHEMLVLAPSYLVIGPGPGNPKTAGISKECVIQGCGRVPIFGICLGHQVIGEVFGAQVVRANRVMHGKPSEIFHKDKGVFTNLPQGFKATRYHSLILDPHTLPDELEITAWTERGEVMGISHKTLPIEGVQFHPESIASESGSLLFENFLSLSKA